MMQFSDDNYGEKRAVEKLFQCIPEKYKQTTRSIEFLCDIYTMSIEEAIDHLNIINDDEPQPLLRSITRADGLQCSTLRWRMVFL
jgi:hypothetical protein